MKVAGCVALLVAVIVVFSQSTTASPSSRLSKRSVNFTPSWGKRSGGYDIHPLVPNLSSEVQSEKCATEMYLRRLVERLQVSDLPHFQLFLFLFPFFVKKPFVTDFLSSDFTKNFLFFPVGVGEPWKLRGFRKEVKSFGPSQEEEISLRREMFYHFEK